MSIKNAEQIYLCLIVIKCKPFITINMMELAEIFESFVPLQKLIQWTYIYGQKLYRVCNTQIPYTVL